MFEYDGHSWFIYRRASVLSYYLVCPLQEHDVAIRFFQRAIQIDPYFTYAYTLLGHEYVLTEELDKAIACFRNAVRLDAR